MLNVREIEELHKNIKEIQNELTAHQANEECTGENDCKICLSKKSRIAEIETIFNDR